MPGDFMRRPSPTASCRPLRLFIDSALADSLKGIWPIHASAAPITYALSVPLSGSFLAWLSYYQGRIFSSGFMVAPPKS